MHRSIGSPLRWAAIVLLLVTAGTHLPLVPMHLAEAPYVGVLFLVLSVVSLALAGLLVSHDTPAVWAVTALVTALAVVAFVWSRTVGLPQIGDDVGDWHEPLGFPALAAELLAAVLAVAALLHHPRNVHPKGTP